MLSKNEYVVNQNRTVDTHTPYNNFRIDMSTNQQRQKSNPNLQEH